VLLRALSSHGGNRTAAARALGIGRATFYRWWREAGLGSEIGIS
jgi:transcriptional regulator of acetoin/glycerol metabolism